MSIKSILSNITSTFNKYGKNVKSTVNRFSLPKIKFIEPLLRSRLFLYILVFITIVLIFTYVNTNNITSIVTFSLVAFLTSFFNKNMIVILSMALIITVVLNYAMRLRYEGFEGKEEDNEEKEGKEEKKEEDKEDKEKKENMSSDGKEDSKKEKEEDKKKDLHELKKDYKEFETIQDKILNGVKDINSQLDKAEHFINKFESYKKKQE